MDWNAPAASPLGPPRELQEKNNPCYFFVNNLITIHFVNIDLPSLRKPSVPEIGPGATALTLTPLGPHSTAKCLVMASCDSLRKKWAIKTAVAIQYMEVYRKKKVITICSFSRASMHLESLSLIWYCCRDVDNVASMLLQNGQNGLKISAQKQTTNLGLKKKQCHTLRNVICCTWNHLS